MKGEPKNAEIKSAELRPLLITDMSVAATIHAQSFERPWDKKTLSDYLAPDGISLGAFKDGALQGFILLGACTDQTDILTIAVSPPARGQHIGRKLVSGAEAEALSRGVELIFLEVAEDNDDAIALYKHCGYQSIGRRKNYYRRGTGRVSAVTMRKTLKPPS